MAESSSPTLLPSARGHDAAPPGVDGAGRTPPAPPRPRLKKLRLASILIGLGMLALVSTVFGMMMAVASDLPALENRAEYNAAKNSELTGDSPECRKNAESCVIAKLTGRHNRILVTEDNIGTNLKNAVIAIEDRRFYTHHGVDYKGIGRAFAADLLRKRAAQGGSTITQQFVKNALSAQGNRSVFQKLREAALAYHLERRWAKGKILTQYLNSVYFGNGAYGVESAMRTYFGEGDQAAAAQNGMAAPQSAEEPAQTVLLAEHATPAQAALLAGMIASPSGYDPVEHPVRAKARRDLVLGRMLDQHMITRAEYQDAVHKAPPTEEDVTPPRPDSKQPYFSSWLTQQLVDRYRPGLVFGGGLKIRTTLDPDLQAAAQQAIAGRLGAIGPDAALVAIENKTGEVKAMVGGANFDVKPFNLATNGHRQPGSAFKPFTLIGALGRGISPEAVFSSQKKSLPVPGHPGERFDVNNYENHYLGLASLRAATTTSDNSVYAEVGLKVGTRRIARLANRMGVRTRLSTNPAMILGGLKEGVTPIEMAYAYSVIANQGMRVSGSLAPRGEGPVAFDRVEGKGIDDKNEKRTERVFPKQIGETATQLLTGVIQGGTGRAAQIGEFAAGKTGTTENYGDAWFCGFNKDLTVCVWVGYADKLRPMETEFHGGPVAGGTFPAEIWHDFMTSWIDIRDTREAESGKSEGDATTPSVSPVPQTPAPTQTAPTPGAPEERPKSKDERQPQRRAPQQQPQEPAQEQPAAPAPSPQPQQPAAGGGGGGAAPGQ